jgi:hypothetical protein
LRRGSFFIIAIGEINIKKLVGNLKNIFYKLNINKNSELLNSRELNCGKDMGRKWRDVHRERRGNDHKIDARSNIIISQLQSSEENKHEFIRNPFISVQIEKENSTMETIIKS